MTLNLNRTSEIYFQKLLGGGPKGKSGGLSAATTTTTGSSSLPGAKARVLLLDNQTTPVVSMSYTQSQLLSNDVVLVELLENHTRLNPMKHLNCVVYVKPTDQSVAQLSRELSSPHYNSYQIFFSNTVSKQQLERLAESDEFDLVVSVCEIFQDYLVVNDNLFTPIARPIGNASSQSTLLLESNSLTSLLLSLKCCPVIKYESNSQDLRKLSSEVLYSINSNSNNNLFDDLNHKRDSPPILLLLDRKNDPITPLLTPWTYQSMIHELMGIKKNVVELDTSSSSSSSSSDSPNLDSSSLTLSSVHDSFYSSSMYLNYGDLTDKVQKYVEEYKTQTKQSSAANLQSKNLSDLKNFLVKFPEFKKFSTNVSKHLNIVSELDRHINEERLWDVGELQQTIAGDLESHSQIKSRLRDLLNNSEAPAPAPASTQASQPRPISTLHKLKLTLLYALRYETSPDNETNQFISKLEDPSLTSPLPTTEQLSLLRSFHKYIGNKTRTTSSSTNANNPTGGLFNGKKFNDLFKNATNQNQPDNIYMQHVPKLYETLTGITGRQQGETSSTSPPPAAQSGASSLTTLVPEAVTRQYGAQVSDHVQDVIVYIKGGVTYEEARLVHEWNNTTSMKLNIIIGGDSILNSKAWVDKLCDLVSSTETNRSQEAPGLSRQAQLRDLL
ncbi:vacuolar protein sorting-associated protein 45 [[Candida] anglica]